MCVNTGWHHVNDGRFSFVNSSFCRFTSTDAETADIPTYSVWFQHLEQMPLPCLYWSVKFVLVVFEWTKLFWLLHILPAFLLCSPWSNNCGLLKGIFYKLAILYQYCVEVYYCDFCMLKHNVKVNLLWHWRRGLCLENMLLEFLCWLSKVCKPGQLHYIVK